MALMHPKEQNIRSAEITDPMKEAPGTKEGILDIKITSEQRQESQH